MRLVFDLEGNGLREDITTVWCASFFDIDMKRKFSITSEEDRYQSQIYEVLKKSTLLIGHNIIDYDFPVLEELYGIKYTGEIFDTLVVSRLLNPDREGGHSLDAWGRRVGRSKPEHEDWSQFSEEMLHRNQEDVEINYLVYLELLKEMEQ